MSARGFFPVWSRTWTLRAALTFLRATADLRKRGVDIVSHSSRESRARGDAARGRAARVPVGPSGRKIARVAALSNGSGLSRISPRRRRARTHLNWALTPANWWVAREEAMMTVLRVEEGAWCAESDERARDSGSNEIYPSIDERQRAAPRSRTRATNEGLKSVRAR